LAVGIPHEALCAVSVELRTFDRGQEGGKWGDTRDGKCRNGGVFFTGFWVDELS